MTMNVNQYTQMFGRALTADEIQAFQIHSMALGQLINNAVFENEFDKQQFIVDETVVASETKKRFPNLYNSNNKINETALNAFLSKQSVKIDDLVKIIDYEARSKIFFGHSRKEDNLLPKPCKTKDSLRPQHATNWEIICTNWAEHLLIGKSTQRDMLNKASRQDARPIKLDPKFLIQEVVGKSCGHLGSSPFYARCMADLCSGLEHPK